MRQSGTLVRQVAVVGTDSHALELTRSIMARPESGYRVVGLVGDDDPDHDEEGVAVLGKRSDIFEILGNLAQRLGFEKVASGPFVRSSYHARDMVA